MSNRSCCNEVRRHEYKRTVCTDVDRPAGGPRALHEDFGGTNATLPHWRTERPGLENEIDELLGFEGVYRGGTQHPSNFWFSQCGEREKLSEDDTSITYRGTEGTVTQVQKATDYHAHTLEWPVKNRADWERVRDRHLQADDPARFPPDWPGLSVSTERAIIRCN